MNFYRKVMHHNYVKLYGGAVNSLSAVADSTMKGHSEGGSSAVSVPSLASVGSLSQANSVSSIQAR